jgi:hypothetical protein
MLALCLGLLEIMKNMQTLAKMAQLYSCVILGKLYAFSGSPFCHQKLNIPRTGQYIMNYMQYSLPSEVLEPALPAHES